LRPGAGKRKKLPVPLVPGDGIRYNVDNPEREKAKEKSI
jgi:hypothetical protein